MGDRKIFHLVTLENGQKDSDAILKVLSDVFEGIIPCSVKLLNYYRELPISFNAEITEVLHDRICMTVHQNQALVMKHEKQTFIKCDYFPNGLGVHAYVALSSINHSRVILNRFSYANIKAEQRRAVRIKLDFPIEGQFTSATGTLKGNLDDISISGISLKLTVNQTMKENVDGRFMCVLPNGTLDVPVRLLKFIGPDTASCAVMSIGEDSKSELLISQFIFSLQVKVIHELKELYI